MRVPVLDMHPGESCLKCKFSVLKPGSTVAQGAQGEQVAARVCRRSFPQVTGIIMPGPDGGMQVAAHADWPMVSPTDWCGEYKPRIDRIN